MDFSESFLPEHLGSKTVLLRWSADAHSLIAIILVFYTELSSFDLRLELIQSSAEGVPPTVFQIFCLEFDAIVPLRSTAPQSPAAP